MEDKFDLSNEAFREEWENGYFDATMGNSFRPPVGRLPRTLAYIAGFDRGMEDLHYG